MCLCAHVWDMDASSLIALLASPPLLTPLHIQLQAFFPPSPSIQAPSQEGGFGGQVRPGRRLHCGVARGRRLVEDEDQGSGPSPRPKTLIWLASRPTKGPPWLGTTSGQEGRWRLEVSAAVMAVTRLRPSLRIGTMEEVYTHIHTASIQLRPCRPSEAEKHE